MPPLVALRPSAFVKVATAIHGPADIAALQHGVSQAVARHVLSHKTKPCGGWKLDELIRTISGDLSDQRRKDRRRELRADADALAQIGILIEAERVLVEHQPDTVEHKPGAVEHKPGGWSISPVLADT